MTADPYPLDSALDVLVALDERMAMIASESGFVLGERFEEREGRALARILATAGWPTHRADRVYAKAGDCSNTSLRALQRKYHAALRALAVHETTPDR